MDLLPLDLVVMDVLPRLDYTSRIRLAAVSKPCRSISRLAPLPAMAEMPWVIGFFGPKQTPSLVNINNGVASPTTHTPRPPKRPEVNDWFLIAGVVDGQAILTSYDADSSTCVTLYNPFSGETRRIIPGPAGLPCGRLRIKMIRILSESGLIVVADVFNRLLVARLGHFDWVDLKLSNVSDFIFYRGELFCSTDRGGVLVFNNQQLLDNPSQAKPQIVFSMNDDGASPINNQQLKPQLVSGKGFDRGSPNKLGSSNKDRHIKYCYKYEISNFVVFKEELFIITCFSLKFNNNNNNDNECSFNIKTNKVETFQDNNLIKIMIEKMDFNRGKNVSSRARFVPRVRVTNLGNVSFFVGEVCSVAWMGMMEESPNFFAPNCVYFMNKHKLGEYSFAKFSMDEVSTTFNFVGFHEYKINSNIPPVWIIPPLN